jgi:hypothetical protein
MKKSNPLTGRGFSEAEATNTYIIYDTSITVK